MLLKLTGSSCSGKSTLDFSVADRLRQVAVHDFDEVGVPERPDRHWRNRMTELGCVARWRIRAAGSTFC